MECNHVLKTVHMNAVKVMEAVHMNAVKALSNEHCTYERKIAIYIYIYTQALDLAAYNIYVGVIQVIRCMLIYSNL